MTRISILFLVLSNQIFFMSYRVLGTDSYVHGGKIMDIERYFICTTSVMDMLICIMETAELPYLMTNASFSFHLTEKKLVLIFAISKTCKIRQNYGIVSLIALLCLGVFMRGFYQGSLPLSKDSFPQSIFVENL